MIVRRSILEIPVEISFVSLDHPDESVLEEYVFGRLSEPKTAVLEEHILICGRCQAGLAEAEEYIRLMKFAASSSLETPRRRSSKRVAIAAAGVLAAACIAVFSWFKPHPPAAAVTLVSVRDGAGAPVILAEAGRPLDLSIPATELPPAPQYRLEVVSSTGESVWSGWVTAGTDKLSAHVTRSLEAGMYWVRLYTLPADLLAEYGLQVN
jgi:hypothetical protein